MEIPGILKEQHVEIPGLILKRSGIFRGDQEKIMQNLLASFCFWPWNFQGVNCNSQEFLGVKLCFI